ncbi:MAG: FAD-dependent oxidoreductase [Chloroflexota bacterium]|jgi:thioredoxin reductase (NADPH)|uniref:FAD/NAD(P)-binding domain-containing protein n=1 Tax=marine metagenome TaxID=408172 RepID=A0A381W842_9ZZZZ|nr:FAD-dependent oxidoreductase [Chloroflexota bacterium]|tara:strand:+ start:5428 stop:6354 length:927 start_codon:yes stop_codon:yes gene_type:complete
MADYDVIIIGGGTAGFSAGMYSSRLGMKTLLVERLIPGGQIINVERIEDYPGLPDGISGADFSSKVQEQAIVSGTEFAMSEVMGIRKSGHEWIVDTYEGEKISKSIIVAGGSTLKKLNVPGENELVGAGVSYCATCDGAFFIDQRVCVVGGGDSALQEAITLTGFASKVDVFCRSSCLHAQQTLQDQITGHEKIQVHLNVEVQEIHGEGVVDGISLLKTLSGESTRVNLDGVFIFVGLTPSTDYLRNLLETDESGHIKTDINLQTSEKGIFAAGDIRANSASQLISSAGDGATAAINAKKYISKGKMS